MVLGMLINSLSMAFKHRLKVLQLHYGLIQRRTLSIHEHHSFRMLEEAGLPVPRFVVASNKNDAGIKARKLGMNNLVVKAQVLAGSRSKGVFKGGLQGGVKVVHSADEAEKIAGQMIGDYLVTPQTGNKGILCNNVMIAVKIKLVKEFYLNIAMEPTFGGPVIVTSAKGGTEIIQQIRKQPDAIFYTPIDIIQGLQQSQVDTIISQFNLNDIKEEMNGILFKLYEIFIKRDAILIEINPLGIDEDGNPWCIDAKVLIDDDASFKQKLLNSLRDTSQEDPRESRAAKFNMFYIAMESVTGNIGCVVNGAGLAMAIADLIAIHGGQPANFLYVTGRREITETHIKEAFKIVTLDPNVMVIFVSIFCEMFRCDIIAKGIIMAVKDLEIDIPIVCRLQGTKGKEARAILAAAKNKILPVPDLEEATRLVVKVARIMMMAKAKNINVNFEFPY